MGARLGLRQLTHEPGPLESRHPICLTQRQYTKFARLCSDFLAGIVWLGTKCVRG